MVVCDNYGRWPRNKIGITTRMMAAAGWVRLAPERLPCKACRKTAVDERARGQDAHALGPHGLKRLDQAAE